MLTRFPTRRAEWAVRIEEAKRKCPAGFLFATLALAAVLMVAHYAMDERAYHPPNSLWKAGAFWSGAGMYAATPFVIWLGWNLLSAGRLKTLKPIFGMAVILCVGSAMAIYVPDMLRSIESMHLHRFDPPIEKWHWFIFRFYWRYWTPLVVIIGNVILLWEFCKRPSFSQSAAQERSPARSSNFTLKILAIAGASAACVVTALHLGLPSVPANRDIINLTRRFLVDPRLRNDFDYLIQHSFSEGSQLAPLLDHLELADLQRHQFYPNSENAEFQPYVLSPDITPLPLAELNWRRTLWENFYPRIRHETDPAEAAQIVVRFLRERVGIDPDYNYRVGIETIWTEQMTDEAGFEHIYVAALRSVGIAARLNDAGKAELFGGKQWQPAPRLPISSLEDGKSSVPKQGLVNFRNWADEDWH